MFAIWIALGCASSTAPAHRSEVVQFTSADLETWTRAAEPLATGLVSLGLSVREDGELWVAGVRPGHVTPWWEREVLGLEVPGLIRRGGAWTETSWRVRDPEAVAVIDPQWLGDELWYMAAEGQEGDPVGPDRTNRIRSQPGSLTRASGQGFADPSPVLFGGLLYVFVTAFPARVEQLSSDPQAPLAQWPGHTVPFATVVRDELWLLVQGNVRGRRQPLLARSRDGTTWSALEPIIPWQSVLSCTSPVMGSLSEGGWILLCVDEDGPAAGG